MKKYIITPFYLLMMLFANNIEAQSIANKKSTTAAPTPQNILSWARELSPELEKAIPKIQRINATTGSDRKSKERFVKAAQLAKEIINKGAKISINDAKKYDTWFRLALSESLTECLESNPGSECCFAGEYQGQGWGGMWFRANCFTARFPDIN